MLNWLRRRPSTQKPTELPHRWHAGFRSLSYAVPMAGWHVCTYCGDVWHGDYPPYETCEVRTAKAAQEALPIPAQPTTPVDRAHLPRVP